MAIVLELELNKMVKMKRNLNALWDNIIDESIEEMNMEFGEIDLLHLYRHDLIWDWLGIGLNIWSWHVEAWRARSGFVWTVLCYVVYDMTHVNFVKDEYIYLKHVLRVFMIK